MQIVEVKNNLVKISYDTTATSLILSGFVVIKDSAQSFIGQILNLEANSKGTFAIVKLLFNFNAEGVISNYNGSIPDIQSALEVVHPSELLELLPVQNPIVLGELAQQQTQLNLDRKLMEQKLLICSESAEDGQTIISNLSSQLACGGKKVLIFDPDGSSDYAGERIVAGKDFKLPLNYETINFIYEKGLDNANAETKAMIQEIFLEVQEYVKTVPDKFIPFESFKDVVDEQYEEMELIELVLLKNKLLKYYEAGVFAQEKSEFESLKSALKSNAMTVLALSQVDEKIQREMISYAYSLMSEADEEIYAFCNVDNHNSDKKLLKQIFSTQTAYTTVICSYAYKYLKELKQISKDLILFAPIQQQSDFASYNVFLEKLNPSEFIVYGHATHYLPLIVKLEKISQNFEVKSARVATPIIEEVSLDEQIKRDVDEIFTAPKTDLVIEEEPAEDIEEIIEIDESGHELTEDDLDLIDDLNIVDNDEIFEIVQDSSDELADEIIVSEFQEFPAINKEENVSQEDTLSGLFGGITEEDEDLAGFEAVEETEEQSELFSEDSLEELVQEEIGEAEEVEYEDQEEAPQATFKEVFTRPETQDNDVAAPALDILPIKASTAPIVPIYSADIEPKNESDEIGQGDIVSHPKYGKGTVEKLITYGSKTLCSIHFDNVGRRLLDPALSEIKKV